MLSSSKRIVLAVVPLLLGGVLAAGALVSPASGAEQKIYRGDFGCRTGGLALRIGRSLKDLQRLGEPKSETSEPPDPFGEETRILSFDGLTIHALFVKKEYGRAFIQHVTITSSKWSIGGGIRVGSSLSELSQSLKVKPALNADLIAICGDTDCVAYSIKQGRISQIDYQCYTG